MFNTLNDNTALVSAFLRAALGVVTAFWPGLFTPEQITAILTLVAAGLALSVFTFKTTVPKTPSVDAKPESMQVQP